MKKLFLPGLFVALLMFLAVWFRHTPRIANPGTATPRAAAGSASSGLSSYQGAVSGAAGTNGGSASGVQAGQAMRRAWEASFLDSVYHLSPGAPVRFELTGGKWASGSLRYVERKEGAVIYAAGDLAAPERGRFFFQRQTLPGKAGAFAGVVEFPGSKVGYRVEPTGPQGSSELVEMPLDRIICLAMPPVDPAVAQNDEMPPLNPSDEPDYQIPDYQEGIIPLQSLPGAKAILYIDYRGGYTPTWGGIAYDRPNVSNAQIKDVWKRVAEDYMPFAINVTTDLRVYQKAAESSRQRCVVTPTTTAAPGAGGVAFMNSWNWTGDTPCWSFYSTGKSAAEVISHEVGHTLTLSHDGQNPSTGYYGGGSLGGEVGWAPIMGVGYYKNVVQWSKGEYTGANNTEDDLARIAGNNNDVRYRPDDTGALLATSRYLEVYPTNFAFAEGVIETTGDTDAFQFTTSGGAMSLRANGVGDWGDLAIQATLCDANNTIIASNNPQTTLWASISTNLPAGTYTFRVTGAGRNDPLTNGFSAYASLGYYTVTGTVANARMSDRFSVAENSSAGTLVGVVPSTNLGIDTLVFRIMSGNTGNAFALDNAGRLTVNNPAALDYEMLAQTNQLPVRYELFVNITNTANALRTELNRRVVVSVLNVNEAPSAPNVSVYVVEHERPGTLVATVAGTDPDFYDLLVYSIIGGDTNGMFTIGAQSGEIDVAGDLTRAVQSVYQLQVRVSDQVGPSPLMATSLVTVTVMPNVTICKPGAISYAVYTNLPGTTMPDLTNATTFPRDPAFEKLMTTFEGDTDRGDNYGSVMRGYLIPPATGNYTFWIASDDSSELWLGTSANPASMIRIAYVSGYTAVRAWNTYSSQKSALRTLAAGQAYYIEARQKDGSGGDNLAVAWNGPTLPGTNVISGLYLAPYSMNYVPHATGFKGTVRRDAFAGARMGRVMVSDANSGDTSTFTILSGNQDGIFGIDPNGWVTVANEAALESTTTLAYLLSVRATDSGTPSLSATTSVSLTIVDTNAITVSALQREMFFNIGGGTAVSDLTNNAKFPGRPDEFRALSDFATPADVADNYGSRIRGYVVPPADGDYRFFIASDDASQLRFSHDDQASNAVVIARVNGYTGTNEWTKEAGQTSAVQTGLLAGQWYYIEALHKEGGGGDHVAVAWTGPGMTGTNVINSSYLQPADLNYPPQFANQTLRVFATAPNGTFIGYLSAADSPLDTLAYRIVGGNTNNTFSLDPGTGALSLADNSLIATGAVTSFSLVVAVQDSGCGGLYPIRTSQAVITVTVQATNAPLVWTGAGGTNSWALPNNWGGAVPADGARLIFGFSSLLQNTNDSVASLGWVQLTNGGFSLSGLPVNLQSGLTNSGSNVWNLNTTLSSPQTWLNSSGTLVVNGAITNGGNPLTIVANSDVRINGRISGPGILAKNGTGKLVLAGAHPYTGVTTVFAASGTTSALEVNGPDDLDISGSDLTMNGRMDLWNHNAAVGALNGSGLIFANQTSHLLTVGGNNHSGNFTGVLSNSSWAAGVTLGLVKAGTGLQILSGSNSYSAGTLLRAGTLYAGNSTALGTGDVTLGDAGTGSNSLMLAASTPVTLANNLVVSSQALAGVTIGTTSINPGTTNTVFAGTLTLNRDVQLQAGSTDRTTFSGQVTGPGGVTVTSPYAATRRVVFSRPSGASNDFAGDLCIGTNAWLQLGMTNSIGNRLIPDTATVQFQPGAQLRLAPAASGDTETVGALDSNPSGAGAVNLVTSTAFTLVFGDGDGSFSGLIVNSAGALSLKKAGLGTQVLSGANSFSGSVTVSGGTLVAANSSALGSAAGGAYVSGAGTLALSNGITILAEPLQLSGAGDNGSGALRNDSGSNVYGGTVTLSGPALIRSGSGTLTAGGTWNLAGSEATFAVEAGAGLFLNGSVTGTGSLVKRGAGALTLRAVNTWAGPITVAEGTVVLEGAASLGSSSPITLSSGAILDVTSTTGGWALNAGQTLCGSGIVRGNGMFSGTMIPGNSLGTLTVQGDATLLGTVVCQIAKSAGALTNDLLACTGTLTLGGALSVTNLGPDGLVAGDSFKLFTAGVFGGGAFSRFDLPALGPGLGWDTSTLSTDGTLRVIAEPATPPSLAATASSNSLTLSWPAGYFSYQLLGQTNSTGTGLDTNWYPVPGVTNNAVAIPIDPAIGAAFYRLNKQ